jgi:hypothetical protein
MPPLRRRKMKMNAATGLERKRRRPVHYGRSCTPKARCPWRTPPITARRNRTTTTSNRPRNLRRLFARRRSTRSTAGRATRRKRDGGAVRRFHGDRSDSSVRLLTTKQQHLRALKSNERALQVCCKSQFHVDTAWYVAKTIVKAPTTMTRLFRVRPSFTSCEWNRHG